MRFTYYPATDTAYILLQEGVSYDSKEHLPNVVADYAEDGALIGIEIESFKSFKDSNTLKGLLAKDLPEEVLDRLITMIGYQMTRVVADKDLIQPLRDLIANGLDKGIAVRAQRLATHMITGKVNEEAAIYYAENIKGMGRLGLQQLDAVVMTELDISPKEAIKRSKRQLQYTLRIVIGGRLHWALNKFLEVNGSDGVLAILEDRLTEEGYY